MLEATVCGHVKPSCGCRAAEKKSRRILNSTDVSCSAQEEERRRLPVVGVLGGLALAASGQLVEANDNVDVFFLYNTLGWEGSNGTRELSLIHISEPTRRS